MPAFKETPEYIQSLKMRPACNRVLREVFRVDEGNIVRYSQKDGVHILDQEFAIDLKVTLPSGGQLSGQEKALSYHFYHYKTFTMEYWQNRYTKEPGEWFKIASQFYLSGYSDKSGIEFIEWKIIKMFPFMIWLNRFVPEQLSDKVKPSGGSRAGFLPVPYKVIPGDCIYAEGFGPGETIVHSTIKDLQIVA